MEEDLARYAAHPGEYTVSSKKLKDICVTQRAVKQRSQDKLVLEMFLRMWIPLLFITYKIQIVLMGIQFTFTV